MQNNCFERKAREAVANRNVSRGTFVKVTLRGPCNRTILRQHAENRCDSVFTKSLTPRLRDHINTTDKRKSYCIEHAFIGGKF